MSFQNTAGDLRGAPGKSRLRRGAAGPLLRPRLAIALYRATGAIIAIAAMELLASLAREPLARVPFVTSVVLVMALPASEAARTRAILGGHLLSSLAGWFILTFAGQAESASALAVGLATFVMIATKTLHPPAGIDAFLITSQGLPASWIVSPVLTGALLLAVYAAVWTAGERRLAAIFRGQSG